MVDYQGSVAALGGQVDQNHAIKPCARSSDVHGPRRWRFSISRDAIWADLGRVARQTAVLVSCLQPRVGLMASDLDGL